MLGMQATDASSTDQTYLQQSCSHEAFFSFQVCSIALLQKNRFLQCNNVLDPPRTAEQQLRSLLNRIAPRNQRTHHLRPALLKDTEIANRSIKGSPVSVHRAEDNLILQHVIADQEVGINFDGGFEVRHTREGEDGIGTQYSHYIEGDLRSSRRFEGEIDSADLLGKLLDRGCFTGDIGASDGLDQVCLRIGYLGA